MKLYAASYGCTTLSSTQKYPLRITGFCYIEKTTGEFKLTYPREVLMKKLEEHIASIQNALVMFDEGAALEFTFFYGSKAIANKFPVSHPPDSQKSTRERGKKTNTA